jgi:flagellar assembly factor FliW
MAYETASNDWSQLQISADNTIHLPSGIFGFEGFKDYVLLENPAEEPFVWLQSVDDSNLAFLMIRPEHFTGEYAPEISDRDAESIGLCETGNAIIYSIVTFQPDGSCYANLKGPLVINMADLKGRQVVPENASEFSLRHRLSPNADLERKELTDVGFVTA